MHRKPASTAGFRLFGAIAMVGGAGGEGEEVASAGRESGFARAMVGEKGGKSRDFGLARRVLSPDVGGGGGGGTVGAWRCHRGDGSSWRIGGERFAPGARCWAAFFCPRGGGAVLARCGTVGGREKTAGGGISDGRRDSSRRGAICLGGPADPVVGVGGPARANWGVLPHRVPRAPAVAVRRCRPGNRRQVPPTDRRSQSGRPHRLAPRPELPRTGRTITGPSAHPAGVPPRARHIDGGAASVSWASRPPENLANTDAASGLR